MQIFGQAEVVVVRTDNGFVVQGDNSQTIHLTVPDTLLMVWALLMMPDGGATLEELRKSAAVAILKVEGPEEDAEPLELSEFDTNILAVVHRFFTGVTVDRIGRELNNGTAPDDDFKNLIEESLGKLMSHGKVEPYGNGWQEVRR